MDPDSVLLIQLQTGTGDWVDVGHLHGTRDQKNWFEFLDSYWNLRDRPVLGQIFEERSRFWRPSARVALPRTGAVQRHSARSALGRESR